MAVDSQAWRDAMLAFEAAFMESVKTLRLFTASWQPSEPLDYRKIDVSWKEGEEWPSPAEKPPTTPPESSG